MRSVRVVWVLLLPAVVGAAGFALAGTVSPRSAASSSPIEQLVAGCPPAADVAAIDAALSLRFEADPTAGTTVCSAAQSGRDLTLVQTRAYQALRVMRSLRYSRPLPWTSRSLYEWFVHTVRGVRFRGDIDWSGSGEPGTYMPFITTQGLFAQADFPPGLDEVEFALGMVSLLAHEARHNEDKPHTCGGYDQTIAEQGAIAIQLELALWNALYSDSSLDGPNADSSSQHKSFRDREFAYAQSFMGSIYICGLPTTNLANRMTASPATVAPGGTVTVTSTLPNAGPGDAANVIVFEDTPTGTKVAYATSSQGSCTVAADHTFCLLGSIPAGATATASVVYKVTAATGARLVAQSTRFAEIHDPTNLNGIGVATIQVAAPAKARPKCKRGQKSTAKKPCRAR